MKNLLGKNEFKKLKKLDSYEILYENNNFSEYDKIYEDMDFSNKTNWSDSLVGRAFNMLFSYSARKMQEIVLNNLKTKLENEYFKGILKAMAKKGIKVEDIETVDLMVDVWLIKSEDIDKDPLLVDKILPYEYEKKVFKFRLPAGENISIYAYEVFPHYSEAKVTVNEKDENIQKDIVSEDNEITPIMITVEGDNRKEIYYIKTDSVEPVDDSQSQTQTQTQVQTPKDTNTNQKLIGYVEAPVENKKSGDIVIYTKKDGEKENVKIVTPELNSKGNLEVQIVNKDGSVGNTIEVLPSRVQVKSQVQVASQTLTKTQDNNFNKEAALQEVNGIWEEMDTVNNRKNPKFGELKNLFRELSKNLHPDVSGKNYNEEEIKKMIVKLKQLKNNLMTNEIHESNYYRFVYNKNFNELFDYVFNLNKLYEAKKVQQTPVKKDSVGKTIKAIVKKLDDVKLKSLGLNKTQSLKSLLDFDRMSANDKELLKVYGNIDIKSLNSSGVAKKFEDNPELRTLATTLVNKESIKEIQLRAEWMYDDEKYKDKGKEAYSRINFTTSGADMSKLKNTWLKKIKSVTSNYLIFFGDKEGRFPQTLDPVALISSDNGFRKDFSEFKSDGTTKKETNLDPTKDIPASPNIINVGKLKTGSPNDEGRGLFVIETTNNQIVAMIYQHLKSGDGHCYKFLGMLDWDKICKDAMDKSLSDDKIKEIIKTYHYDSKNLDMASDKFKSIYKSFRGSDKWGDIGANVNNSTIAFFKSKNVESGGPQNMPQILIKSEDDWKTTKGYVAQVKEKKLVEKFKTLDEFKGKYNSTQINTNFKFSFNVKYNYTISEDAYDIWGIQKLKSDENRNKALKSMISEAKQLNLISTTK